MLGHTKWEYWSLTINTKQSIALGRCFQWEGKWRQISEGRDKKETYFEQKYDEAHIDCMLSTEQKLCVMQRELVGSGFYGMCLKATWKTAPHVNRHQSKSHHMPTAFWHL